MTKIDLRIALEALFAPAGSRSELGYRIAQCGAWYLGQDADDRLSYFETLKSAYDMASRAVHLGSLDGKKSSTGKFRNLLTKAQNACRQALIRRICEGAQPPDPAYWKDLVLGKTD